ncbi:MAG: exodeoxyribonuclease III [Gammaproteobacteria bacterium]|nr:exodeoxyribonuclease III [Gammaproteobacteria bacterium]|tara:strand:+ start:1121 stop:1891 length:771 start_codon:yes stop_codon:yes gene_type:complete
MKIATWNINGFGARMDFLKRWLADRQPDVVGLQELKLVDDAFPHDEFEALGYQAVTHGQKAWNGVAVLSRLPLSVAQSGLPGQEEAGARLLTVNVADQLEFTTVYCPNGKTLEHDDYEMKLAWFDALIEFWNARNAERAVLCGDFNIVPTPLDGWRGTKADGDIFHTKQERDRLQRVLELGLTDLYRHKYPGEQAFSWWDYRGGSFHRGHGLRIDLILGTAAVRDNLLDVGTDRDYRKKQDGMTASDHAPVIAELH